MLTMLDDGLWEADARLELEELARSGRPAPVARQRTRSTRSAAWSSCSPGTFPAKGECVDPPVGLDGSKRSIPTRGGSSACASTRPTREVAPSLVLREQVGGSAIALNSSALPAGSSRNIVACSPGWPSKRTVGAITNSTPAASSRSASAFHSSIASTSPKCGTGTSSPSTGLVDALRARVQARGARRSDGRSRSKSTHRRRCALPGSRAARRRSARAAARSSTGKARWKGGKAHGAAPARDSARLSRLSLTRSNRLAIAADAVRALRLPRRRGVGLRVRAGRLVAAAAGRVRRAVRAHRPLEDAVAQRC